ncbi:aminotransferase-like domain-containing protein [Burkholderia vietnamiensis]|uniref:aminotransferase-like domain-containing protein n=1 Tax=Burkholderia vietnamiensis TaxID=60552 RepID=UPI001CAB4C8B|nr:PLP-dependent aminotransferase family protein [Burkholderia vietnamiensis]CAG9224693.1 Transcriptional regulator, GntR family / Aspartate aminotransferase [Burkholderia vietnamiensis]
MKLALDTTTGVPLNEQLARQLEQMIRSRHLRSGVKLPSIRKMAADQQISRFPVIEAYDTLAARGLIQPRHGAGFYVTDRFDRSAPVGGTDPQIAEEESGHILEQFASTDDRFKLSSGFMPAAWRDVDGIAQAIRHVVRSDAASLVDYAQPQGDPLLRQYLSGHLAPLGIHAQPQQILVTHSASHALDLVVRLMLKPGDTVFVEDPGYFNLFGLLKLHGVKLVGVPRRATGPDVEITEALLREHRPKLFFVNTAFHNPTATNIAPPVMFRLLQLAHRHDFTFVEDDVYADFEAAPSQRLATLDQFERVIYLSGFSKALSSSLRIGYLAARPELIKPLVELKALTSMGGARLAESIVASLLERGTHRKHLERLRRRLAQASASAVTRLRHAGWEVFEQPSGGMFVWARVPGVEDSALLCDTARTFGLDLAPGREYRPNGEATPWVRLNVAAASDPLAEPFIDAAAGLAQDT